MSGRRGSQQPGLQRTLLTVCAMTATIMQALDTTVANVALPYMQGSLSASIDQINWVLTSYIVASAILTAPVGWLAARFGQKKLFVVCAAGFTFASLLCGLAQTIEQMVMFRLLQGAFGAGLIPLSQSVMLESYPIEQRGSAMAIWGMGVMLGPIMGPTIGGWLTDHYSWHWVFLINLPIGIITVAGLLVFMDETDKRPRNALRLVRLRRAGGRHRFAATDDGPRRAARLVRFDRNRHRTHRRDRRFLLFPGAFADDRRAVRALRAVQGSQLRRRLRFHGRARIDRLCHHGAIDAVSAERHRLSGALGRPADGGARRRHHGGHAGGRQTAETVRGAQPDLCRHAGDGSDDARNGRLHEPHVRSRPLSR